MDKELKIDLKCIDAIQGMKGLQDESVDLIVTDPPYNLSKDYGETNDNLSCAVRTESICFKQLIA